MMSCKDVSTVIARGELAQAPIARRLAVRLHLAFCRHCRAFQQHLEALSRAARAASVAHPEPDPGFEDRLTRRLRDDRQTTD